MVKVEEITSEKIKKGQVFLMDNFGKEITKLKAIANMISSVSQSDNALAIEDTRIGLSFALDDISAEIKKGLEHLEKEIRKDVYIAFFAEHALELCELGIGDRYTHKSHLAHSCIEIDREIMKLQELKARCMDHLEEIESKTAI